MKKVKYLSILLAFSLALQPGGTVQAQTDSLPTGDTGLLTRAAHYATGLGSDEDGGVAEIVKFNSDNQKLYIVSGKSGTLRIVPTGELAGTDEDILLNEEKSVDIKDLVETHAAGFSYGDISSVAVNTLRGVIGIAVQSSDYAADGRLVLLDYNGGFISSFATGVQPDMVTFTPDGIYALTADEGEPREGYGEGATDPRGTVTILNLDTNAVIKADFTSFDSSTERAALIANKVILKKDTAPSVDLEPEYITVSSDSTTAYVTLQEANAIATVSISEGKMTHINGLGFKDHSLPENALDVVTEDKAIRIQPQPNLYGIYMPDGITSFDKDGVTYLLTANEGDSRDWPGYLNEITTSVPFTLNTGTQEAPQTTVVTSEVIYLDTSDYDGQFDDNSSYLFGGRSFSIWKVEANGAISQAYDSGSLIETKTAQLYPEYFNASNSNIKLDSRSGKKGPEPEDITLGRVNGKTYAFVGLERIGGVMAFDVTNPGDVLYKDYLNTRDFSSKIAGDVAPEGITFIDASDSPNSYPMLAAAYEVSGTVSLIKVNEGYTPTINIFHTNDVHGSFVSSATVIGADKAAAVKQSVAGALLVDAGDATQGSSFASLSQGASVISLMNAAGYNAMAAGNHEFDYGQDILLRNANAAYFPILSANTVKDGKPFLEGTTYQDGTLINNGARFIQTVNGIKVGFFGITTPETATKSNPAGLTGINFADPAETSRAQIAALKDEGAQVIIGLMHLGVDASTQDGWKSIDVARALEGEGVDAIIDGHSHSLYPAKATGGILIQQTETAGKYIGRIKITLSEDKARVETVSGKLLSAAFVTRNYTPDAAVTGLANEITEANKELLAPVVGKTLTTLWGGTINSVNEARLYETNLGSLVADSMAWQASLQLQGTDSENLPVVALQNGGGVRATIKAGDITRGDSINVLPFGNILSFKEITPDILYEALENGVSRVTAQDPQSGKITGIDGRFPQISGMRFEYNPALPSGSRVTAIYLDGSTTPLSRTDSTTPIVLASNDFEIAGGDGYTMLKDLKHLGEGGSLDIVFADYLSKLTSENGGEFYQAPSTGRIKTVGVYTPKAYDAAIPVKDANQVLVTGTTVTYRVDNGTAVTTATDAFGLLNLAGLSDGPHGVIIEGHGEYLVNNYSGVYYKGPSSVPDTDDDDEEEEPGTPSTPSTSTGTSANTGITTRTGSDGSLIASIKVTATEKSGSAEVVLTSTQIASALASLKAGTSGSRSFVEIQVPVTSATSLKATLPAGALKNLSKGGIQGIIFNTSLASISFDGNALKSLAEKTSAQTLTLSAALLQKSTDANVTRLLQAGYPVYSFELTTSGAGITAFGEGSATLSLPYLASDVQQNGSPTVFYIDGSGRLVRQTGVYNTALGSVTFTTDHFSLYAIKGAHSVLSFGDVSESSWNYDGIYYLTDNGLISGTGNGLYKPNATITRAEFTAILHRLSGQGATGTANPFKDVSANSWYASSVAWAYEKGIVSGSNGSFNPNLPITRQDMAILIHRFAKTAGLALNSNQDITVFADDAQISSYARDAVYAVQSAGILSGNDKNNYAPLDNATRGEAASILTRLLKVLP